MPSDINLSLPHSLRYRNFLIMIVAFTIHIGVVLGFFSLLQSTVFSVAVLPAIAGGWLYGRKLGVYLGIIAAAVSFGCQIALGIAEGSYLYQTLFGGPIIILVGAVSGHLRDVGIQSRLASQGQLKAEESKRKLERQLQHSQKMEAIGTLAGGVAHDINNILGIIMSSSSVLKEDIKNNTADLNDLENILSACRRGKDLTQNLLGFARKGTYVKEVLDIKEVIQQAVRFINPVMDKNIHIEIKHKGSLHQIYGDRGQIEQSLVNICINAAEAIGNRGTIRITTQDSTEKGGAFVKEQELKPGQYIQIDISDDGPGIESETLQHVFEPFFTTKSPGKGTGLGLSMAYGTMNKHDGCIGIQSAPGNGTTITMLIPSLVKRREIKQKKRHSYTPLPQVTGCILLVDDEPLIRSSNKRMLMQLGYEVLLAEGGEQAIELYQENKQRVSLVILDFVMPGLNGAETLERLKEINPDVNVLISSGYSKDGNIESALQKGALGFIQKPFDREHIAVVIKEIQVTEQV